MAYAAWCSQLKKKKKRIFCDEQPQHLEIQTLEIAEISIPNYGVDTNFFQIGLEEIFFNLF
jgi:hypothetical protein